MRRRGSVEAYRRCRTLSRAAGHRYGQAAPAAKPSRRRPHPRPPIEAPRRTAPSSNLYILTPPRRRPSPAPRRKPAGRPPPRPRLREKRRPPPPSTRRRHKAYRRSRRQQTNRGKKQNPQDQQPHHPRLHKRRNPRPQKSPQRGPNCVETKSLNPTERYAIAKNETRLPPRPHPQPPGHSPATSP